MNKTELNIRAHEPAKNFLRQHGMDIVNTSGNFVFAHKPFDKLLTVSHICATNEVSTTDDMYAFADEELPTRTQFENILIRFLMANCDYEGCTVRFDQIAMVVVDPEHAMVRYHKGCCMIM